MEEVTMDEREFYEYVGFGLMLVGEALVMLVMTLLMYMGVL
jgi:hypothetical protein